MPVHAFNITGGSKRREQCDYCAAEIYSCGSQEPEHTHTTADRCTQVLRRVTAPCRALCTTHAIICNVQQRLIDWDARLLILHQAEDRRSIPACACAGEKSTRAVEHIGNYDYEM